MLGEMCCSGLGREMLLICEGLRRRLIPVMLFRLAYIFVSRLPEEVSMVEFYHGIVST